MYQTKSSPPKAFPELRPIAPASPEEYSYTTGRQAGKPPKITGALGDIRGKSPNQKPHSAGNTLAEIKKSGYKGRKIFMKKYRKSGVKLKKYLYQ